MNIEGFLYPHPVLEEKATKAVSKIDSRKSIPF